MANISGMEQVLGDRCIMLALEKSTNMKITRLIEDFKSDFAIIEIKKTLEQLKDNLGKMIEGENISNEWNNYILTGGKIFFNETTNNEKARNLQEFFKKIDETGIEGRNLELILPLYFIAYLINDENKAFKTIIEISKEIIKEKEEEEAVENNDKVLLDFLKAKITAGDFEYNDFISPTKIANQFKEYLGEGNEWVSPRWMGIALKRMKLIKSKKRESKGMKIILEKEKLLSS